MTSVVVVVALAGLLTAQLWIAALIRACRGWGRGGRMIARCLYRHAYLKTPWWRMVSVATKRRAGMRCEACRVRSVALDAHHKGRAAYALLGREWAPWRGLTPLLEALCRPCHARKHR